MPQELSTKGGAAPGPTARRAGASGWEIKVSKLEGLPSTERGKFAQVFEYAPEAANEERGLLFAVVELKTDPMLDPALAGKLVWDTLAEEYYAPSEETAIQALEQAVHAARNKLQGFSQMSTLDLVGVAFLDNVAYFARLGHPVLYLRRQGETRSLLPGDEVVSVGSQILEDGDVLILGSPGFAKNFNPQNLPETEFLVKEFEEGRPIPGLLALLVRISALEVKESKLMGVIKTVVKRLSPTLSAIAPRLANLSLPAFKLSRLITVLAVVLVLSVAFTLWRQSQKTRAAEFDRLLAVAAESLGEAEGLRGLSNERALKLVEEAKASLANATRLSPKSEKIGPLVTKATGLYNDLEKITPIGDEHVVYDLQLKVSGARGISLAGSGETLYVAEEKSDQTLVLKLDGQPSAVEVSQQAGGAEELVIEEDYLYLRKEDGFKRFNLGSKEIDDPVEFDRYSKVIAAGTYLGNIYFLVPEEDQIYKFLVTESGYSSARPWLKDALVLDTAVDLTIDGEVWVLTNQGQVLRLGGGNKQTFLMSNLSTPFKQASKIFTRSDLNHLYVLDSGFGRVAVFDKEGEFVRQFKGEGMDLTDLWVSPGEKYLYLLSGSKVYRLDL